ncbi:AAA family ATPase [Thiomicrospira microaerophila]|uniref:AAA family ATPase n=1 Tax=Thiomicrospira microaerophila TaxID=406020 RepID=UPI0005C817EB|nr:ATP-binding protein [Thiomicrospira microaerophila]
MIRRFGFKNFYSFKEGAEVSFELPSVGLEASKSSPSVGTILCVKGKNASGKTNLLKALNFLHDFCCHSFITKPDSRLWFSNYFSNPEPTEFYIEFESLSTRTFFRYELVLQNNQVLSEVLYRKEARLTKLIERQEEVLTVVVKSLDSIRPINMRKNASFISTQHQYALDKTGVLLEVYNFFLSIHSNVFPFGLRDGNFIKEHYWVSKIYFEDSKAFELAKSLIRRFDTGVKDIQIVEKKDPETDQKRYIPVFYHETATGELESLLIFDQSHGTRSLFSQIVLYSMALDAGGVLCMDEFDKHLHPDILPELLQLFTEPAFNPHNAQLIFSTHDTDILDVMGKYRTYIVDKENNESFCYRLDEIQGSAIRNDRPLAPLYRSGKLGGVPLL